MSYVTAHYLYLQKHTEVARTAVSVKSVNEELVQLKAVWKDYCDLDSSVFEK